MGPCRYSIQNNYFSIDKSAFYRAFFKSSSVVIPNNFLVCYPLLFLKTIISPTIPTITPIRANGKSLKLANTVRFISAPLALKSIPNRITAIPFNLLSFILFTSITFQFIAASVYHQCIIINILSQ